MNWQKVRIGEFLKKYRIEHYIKDDVSYKQITISKHNGVSFRGIKIGSKIGRKRQFIVDLKKYPKTVLFTRQGILEGSIGVAPNNVNGCVVTENMPTFEVVEKIINFEYLKYFIHSRYFIKIISRLTPTGSAQKSLHEKDILKLEVRIPPLQEQKKIAEKLKIYQAKQQKLKEKIQNQKIYFQKLKSQILQDGIRGKLTKKWREENPNLEPASELLKKIKEEKEKLVAEKKVKKQKKLAPIEKEEIPFSLPKGWVWTKLGEIGKAITGTTPSTLDNDNFNSYYIPFIKPADIKNNIINYNNEFLSKKGLMSGRFIPKNSILMVCIGGSIGKSALSEMDVSCNQQINAIDCILANSKLIKFIFDSNYFQKLLWKTSSGATTPILNKSKWENLFIPLPPLQEQKAIADKLQKLIKKIEKAENILEESLKNCQLLKESIFKIIN